MGIVQAITPPIMHPTTSRSAIKNQTDLPVINTKSSDTVTPDSA
jgi:hypothetical protein